MIRCVMHETLTWHFLLQTENEWKKSILTSYWSMIRNFPNFNSHPTLSRSYSQYVEDNADYRYVTDFELSDQELFQFFMKNESHCWLTIKSELYLCIIQPDIELCWRWPKPTSTKFCLQRLLLRKEVIRSRLFKTLSNCVFDFFVQSATKKWNAYMQIYIMHSSENIRLCM